MLKMKYLKYNIEIWHLKHFVCSLPCASIIIEYFTYPLKRQRVKQT